MLVLSRKDGESIMIGDDIKITIFDIKADKTQVGISAPKDTKIHRLEVYKAIQAEKGKEQK